MDTNDLIAARTRAEYGVDELRAENIRLRARERRIIDQTWGEALEDGSVPSTKLQDKIIAAVDALEQKLPRSTTSGS